MGKYNKFRVIATASQGERVPKVAGAFYFGLPYVMDPDVDWAKYFGGVEPRAFLVAKYEDGHAKAGMVRPLDIAVLNGADAEAAEAEAARFLGVAIEGTDWEDDENMTVALAGGIPYDYIQHDQELPAYVVEPAVLTALKSGLLPVRLEKKYVFWNVIQ